MKQERWLRIIPVALIMYTISYIDRTNVALALDPKLSSMMSYLKMDDRIKGDAVGFFFFGYLLLQIPGGYLANRWSAKKVIGIFLVFWGLCAVGGGFVTSVGQFKAMRFMLGVAESGVFPATLVLLANWFPRPERARANAYWNLCQPLAVAGAAPVTGYLLGIWGWRAMLVLEGALPFLWLPVWWYFISDHPREAKWISAEERQHLETTLAGEATGLQPVKQAPLWKALVQPAVFVMVPIYFLQNCAAYGCNTFLSEALKSPGKDFTPLQTGLLYAVPYLVAAAVMVLNSWHSDKTQERRGHVALAYGTSGALLCPALLGRSRPVRGAGALLGDSSRDDAARRNGHGHGAGERLRQCGGLGRKLCLRLAEKENRGHHHSVQRAGDRIARRGRALLSVAQGEGFRSWPARFVARRWLLNARRYHQTRGKLPGSSTPTRLPDRTSSKRPRQAHPLSILWTSPGAQGRGAGPRPYC